VTGSPRIAQIVESSSTNWKGMALQPIGVDVRPADPVAGDL